MQSDIVDNYRRFVVLRTTLVRTANLAATLAPTGKSAVATGSAREEEPGKAMGGVNAVQSTGSEAGEDYNDDMTNYYLLSVESCVISAVMATTRVSR